ncbi:MAG: glycosyltransferase, partial [Deltaproteobacteria bacterium]|nr:glycosyltransferase [Deltaproteobacteria bacterium]
VVWDAFVILYDTVVEELALLGPRHPLARLLYAWEWLAARACNLVLLDTRAHGDYFAELFGLAPGRVADVPVGAEGDRFPVTQPPPLAANDELRLLFYGQFIPLHGIDTIVRAIVRAARLAQEEAIQWTLIGSGQEEAKIRALLDAQPLARLTWIPWVEYEELSGWIQRADVCLGIFGATAKAGRVIPNKVYQILSAGAPLITRDSPAIRELLPSPPPQVILVPPVDPQALLSAVHSMRSILVGGVAKSGGTPVGRAAVGRRCFECQRERPRSQMTSTDPDLSGVRREGMCIACGACRAVDDRIQLQVDPKRLIYEPDSAGDRRAAEVCPSTKVDYEQLHRFVFGSIPTGPVGLVDSIRLAQSTDLERNRRASSGGLIKEAIGHLLESGRVEAVIAIGHHEGLEYRAQLVSEADEIDRLPGSIYHNIDLSSALELVTCTDQRLGLVAIPCQLEGIYNFVSKRRPELRERIGFTIGLLCAAVHPAQLAGDGPLRGLRPGRHRRSRLPRRGSDRQTAGAARRRTRNPGRPACQSQLPDRIRSRIQHTALQRVHQPHELPGRSGRRRFLDAKHALLEDGHQHRHLQDT